MFLIITYDVPSKRTQIYKKLIGEYLERNQNSVFFGEIKGSLYKDLMYRINKIRINEDNLLYFIIENKNNIEVLGENKILKEKINDISII